MKIIEPAPDAPMMAASASGIWEVSSTSTIAGLNPLLRKHIFTADACNVIPTISAVGHEIDYTISDFVADKRAVTPTQGAMLATPDIESLKAEINYYLDSYNKRIKQIFQNLEINLVNISTMLDSYKPTKALENKEKELRNKYQQLKYIFERILINKENSFRVLDNTLQGINPLKIMDRGYSITSINDKIITDVNEVKIDDVIKTEMKNGYIKAKVIEVKENER